MAEREHWRGPLQLREIPIGDYYVLEHYFEDLATSIAGSHEEWLRAARAIQAGRGEAFRALGVRPLGFGSFGFYRPRTSGRLVIDADQREATAFAADVIEAFDTEFVRHWNTVHPIGSRFRLGSLEVRTLSRARARFDGLVVVAIEGRFEPVDTADLYPLYLEGGVHG